MRIVVASRSLRAEIFEGARFLIFRWWGAVGIAVDPEFEKRALAGAISQIAPIRLTPWFWSLMRNRERFTGRRRHRSKCTPNEREVFRQGRAASLSPT